MGGERERLQREKGEKHMWIGFGIWTAVALVFLFIGIGAWRSKEAAGFYAGIKPPKVRDTGKYNRAVAVLWVVSAFLFELLGIPLLTRKRNSPAFLWSIFGSVALVIGMMVAYQRILRKYEDKT